MTTDKTIEADLSGAGWSDLSLVRSLPAINIDRMRHYRLARIREQISLADAALLIVLNPVALRYCLDFRNYLLFQSHIPSTCLMLGTEGPIRLFGAYDQPGWCPAGLETRPMLPASVFDAGPDTSAYASGFADQVLEMLADLGTGNRRVALEYINPSITRALESRGLEVIDGSPLSEMARVIKSDDELCCMRWSVAVAELGLGKLADAIRPGVTENQLWALLNYTNLANNGDWHEGRMLASGPRTNPWYQEATDRRVESGDLVGLDTDMVGPYGYFADISRTFFCGPGQPSIRQKALYRLAVEEIEHNMKLVKPGVSFESFRQAAWKVPEEFQANAYTVVAHGVGMCDEYPRINPVFRGENPYAGTIEQGMVLCIESYIGAEGERDGVKLEQQVLVTEDGCELLTHFPYDAELLD